MHFDCKGDLEKLDHRLDLFRKNQDFVKDLKTQKESIVTKFSRGPHVKFELPTVQS